MLTLTQGSLETSEGISLLEEAAAVLYRAILASRDNGEIIKVLLEFANNYQILEMTAMMERIDEYQDYKKRFCKRLLDHFTIIFSAQVSIL